MTWAEKEKPENQRNMIDTYTKLANETGTLLAPIGRIWAKIRERYPDIELYYRDGQHASVYGDYLIAATFLQLSQREMCQSWMIWHWILQKGWFWILRNRESLKTKNPSGAD